MTLFLSKDKVRENYLYSDFLHKPEWINMSSNLVLKKGVISPVIKIKAHMLT